MRYRWLLVTTLAVGWLLPKLAQAESFKVKVKVLCPAYFKSVNGVTVFDPNLASKVPELVPCPGIKVKAKDADPDWDDTCGSGYTNLEGKAEFNASCDDVTGKPDVYVEVYAKSVHGWEITAFDWLEATAGSLASVATISVVGDLDDAVTASDEYSVRDSTEKHPSNNATLDYGTVGVGDAGDNIKSRREFVGSLFFLSDLSVRTMQAIGYESPLLDNTNWVIDSIVGSPTTIWNDIVIDASARDNNSKAIDHLQAAAHEFGHVFHNERHSGEAHWLNDAVHYMHHHSSCDKFSERFGWYEGFANFVRDVVYDTASTVSNDTLTTGGVVKLRHKSLWEPFAIAVNDCDDKSPKLEGNVESVLVDWYFGNYESQSTAASTDLVTAMRFNSDLTTHLTDAVPVCGGSMVQMPTWSAADMFGLVKVARDAKAAGRISDNHSIYDYWYAGIYPNRCDGKYCGSKTFATRTATVLSDPIGFEAVASNCKTPVALKLGSLSMAAAASQATPRVSAALTATAKKRLHARAEDRKLEVLATVPKKSRFRVNSMEAPDWYEKGVTSDRIANVDFAARGANVKTRFDVSPHVRTALSTQLATRLKRVPTAAEIDAAIADENAKIGRVNAALAKSPELRKAIGTRDVKGAREAENAVLRQEMGIKPDPDAAIDPTPLTRDERRKMRDRLAASLINDTYK